MSRIGGYNVSFYAQLENNEINLVKSLLHQLSLETEKYLHKYKSII